MKDEPKISAKRSRSQRAMIHYQEGKAGSSGFQAVREEFTSFWDR
jgi:hypothetical protein